VADTQNRSLLVRELERLPYQQVWQAMRDFNERRTPQTPDEIWLLEHDPVFTQGQAGKPEHILSLPDNIPLVQSDRGGQVTYHGPGQLIAYPLLNLKRLNIGVRQLVDVIEQSVVTLLEGYDVRAYPKADAPGVYVDEQKVASLGLRIRKGHSFHGVAINFAMDLSPFLAINPCGYLGLQMTQLSQLVATDKLPTFERFRRKYARILGNQLGYSDPSLDFSSRNPF
jgi:lipoyl(octanoyl) transferase